MLRTAQHSALERAGSRPAPREAAEFPRAFGWRDLVLSAMTLAAAVAILLSPGRLYVATGLDSALAYADGGYRLAAGGFRIDHPFGLAATLPHALAFGLTSDAIASIPIAHAMLAALVMLLAAAIVAPRLPALVGTAVVLALSLFVLVPSDAQERFGAALVALAVLLLLGRRSRNGAFLAVDIALSGLVVLLAVATSLAFALVTAALVCARPVLSRLGAKAGRESRMGTLLLGLAAAAAGAGAAVAIALHTAAALTSPDIPGIPSAYRSLRIARSGTVGAMEAALNNQLDGAGAFAAARLQLPTTAGTALSDEEYLHTLAAMASARDLCGPDRTRAAVFGGPNLASSFFGQPVAGPASFAASFAGAPDPLRGVGCLLDPKLPLRPAEQAAIWTRLGDQVATEFRAAGETPYWRVLVPKSSPVALPTAPTGRGETAALELHPSAPIMLASVPAR
jgi:hypothetical protein